MNMGITCIISSLADASKTLVDSAANAPDNIASPACDSQTVAEYIQYEQWKQTPWDVFTSFKTPDIGVISTLTGYSIVFGILFVLILAGCWFGLKKVSPRFRSGTLSLKGWFTGVAIYGFIVYDVGMCTGDYISLLTNAPMALLYAFRIFVFNSDVSEIQTPFHINWFYSLNFALVHFMAAVISTLFLIKYFGYNILCWWRMWLTCRRARKCETYVFWGFNDSSANLIRSIKQHYGNSTDYHIVIVRTNLNNNETPEERTSLARIFDFLAMPTAELERLQTLGCLTTGSYTCLSNINVLKGETDIIGNTLNLKLLKRFIESCADGRIHMIFLSDNERENIHNVSLLLHDSTIQDFIRKDPVKPETPETGETADHFTCDKPKEREVIFYCLARYNSVHRVIEDQHLSDKVKVRVVDSSHINVQMIEQDEELQPVNFVKVEADGTVSSLFHALVVGFSEVGQDSVKFLYEFGAFVKHGSDNTNVVRSKFHLDVVDKNMADLAGTFVANAPAINPSLPFINGKENSEALIELHQMDCRSVEFYLKLREEWIKTLNYVVIATENDELNISLGVRIFKLATRYRDDLSNFCILVRAHDDEDGHIRGIAEHYNRLWAAQLEVKDFTGREYIQEKILLDAEIKSPIHIFGLDKTTFTYTNIIDDSLEIKAIEYKEQYEASSNIEYQKPTECRYKAWYKEMRQLLLIPENTTEQRKFHPSLCGIQTLRRKQGQDIANSLHAATKRILAQKALDRVGIPDFDWTPLSRVHKTITYTLSSGASLNDRIEKILNTIAQTEHLRWNASHEILGYEPIKNATPGSRNEIKMQHSCIAPWQRLDDITKSYDYNVVDVTLGIINPDDPIK